MRRSDISAARPFFLLRKLLGKRWNERQYADTAVCVCAAFVSDEWRKTLDLFLDFPYCVSVFRSILYAFRSLHPKITENLPIN